ncbi:uncharacterized protein TRIVIDRAFT_205738 [Trichoderma virens Gv29-8]|uniref:Uncharacterized protein n=1 Tax=Hypocrea virens (strain Gv29-8 / FGSC 10586) TaxID=413071 RepID=G9N812_HYPVG|nr:uncharacterized protein TRIVIDRAFT_205738 [Trichoderma virens Gv29-8]EHK17124.1 hypothetical protein TRIVIDRAFT_205738 [Trichoderma virens Gv29-8]
MEGGQRPRAKQLNIGTEDEISSLYTMPPKKVTPMKTDGTREFATSIVRFSVQHAHRDKIGASKEWFAVMDNIKRQPDFGYVCKGELIDDELDIVLFIAWEHAAKPPATFSENLDSIFSPLHNFLAKRPQITDTVYRVMKMDRQSTGTFDTTGSGCHSRFINEFMTVRGPAQAIEPELEAIQEIANSYMRQREVAEVLHGLLYDTFSGLKYFRLDDNDSPEANEDPLSHAPCAFALVIRWSDEQGRAEFQDPNIPDSSQLPGFPSNFWQEVVIQRLEKQGASISSWLYQNADIARDEKNKLLIAEEFENLWPYSY